MGVRKNRWENDYEGERTRDGNEDGNGKAVVRGVVCLRSCSTVQEEVVRGSNLGKRALEKECEY